MTGYRGNAASNADILTIKYDSAGQQEWEQTYNGTANGVDIGEAIVVDDSGNVFVVGKTASTGTGSDIVVIRYDSGGSYQWAALHDGAANGNDAGTGITLDSAGDILATGYVEISGNDLDYATLKLSLAGSFLWTGDAVLYDGPATSPASSLDEAGKVATDSSNNVYVAGYSEGDGTGEDYGVVKYNTNGTFQWVYRYDNGGDDKATDIGVDADNLYVTGYSDGTGDDYLTLKLDLSSGSAVWGSPARYNYPSGTPLFQDRALAIAVHSSGSIYVTGNSYKGASQNHDYTTIKYLSDGTQAWTADYNGPDSGQDKAVDIVIDSSGSAYVTGYSYGGAGTGYDYATVKYDNSGNEVWKIRYDGPESDGDIAYAMAIDGARNLYVTGVSQGLTTEDAATVKYRTLIVLTPILGILLD